jgi:outer membrane protein
MFRTLVVLALIGEAAAAADDPVKLTLRRAIELALANRANPDVQIAQEAEQIAGARQAQGRAAMLPSLESSLAGQNQTRNLAAQGFQFATPSGFTIPETVGPFNSWDTRLALTQPVFDWSAVRRLRAASARTAAAGEESERRRDELAAEVARLYVRVLRDDAELAAAEAAIRRTGLTLDAARNRVDAGSGIGIEVRRAEYQVAVEEQRRVELRGDRDRAVLALLDAIGQPFDTQVEFEDRLEGVKAATEGAAIPSGEPARSRRDVTAQRTREASLQKDAEAIRLEALPTVAAYADVGALGGRETHTIGLMVRVPVFDAGRRKAREAELDAMARQEGARAAKLERAVDLQVRQAQIAMRTAAEQLKLAEASASLAEAEWEHSRRRHEVGITGVLEVIEAQARLATAARERIDALYRCLAARIDALDAAGGIRELTI